MEVHKITEMKGGWFIGNFTPTVYSTAAFEVCYKEHVAGEEWEIHYHKQGTEINYLIEGEMIIQNKTLTAGDIFVLHPYEIADPIFLKDCKVLVVKTPSLPGDKFNVSKK